MFSIIDANDIQKHKYNLNLNISLPPPQRQQGLGSVIIRTLLFRLY